MRNGKSPAIKLVHSFTVMVSSNLPPLASFSAAAVKTTFPLQLYLIFIYMPWVCTSKGVVRFHSTRKAQGLSFAIGRSNTKIYPFKMKFRSPVARFSNISIRNIDANPIARVTAGGENRFFVQCGQ